MYISAPPSSPLDVRNLPCPFPFPQRLHQQQHQNEQQQHDNTNPLDAKELHNSTKELHNNNKDINGRKENGISFINNAFDINCRYSPFHSVRVQCTCTVYTWQCCTSLCSSHSIMRLRVLWSRLGHFLTIKLNFLYNFNLNHFSS